MFDNKPNCPGGGVLPGTGIRPHNTGERRAFHYIDNIYNPEIHTPEDMHRYVVPQENELVFDVLAGRIYRVAHVDWGNDLKSTLVDWNLEIPSQINTFDQDWVFGVRGGPLLGEALLSIDYSVRPNRARVDSTIMRPGAAYAKVYLGNTNERVISAQYDSSSNMISNKVPTMLAEIIDSSNLEIMTTGPFSVTESEHVLVNGKRCMLLFFDEGGNFIPPAQPLVVQHSTYMRDHQIGIKYITSIELINPWFTDAVNPERMTIPINVNLLSVEFRARVHYSDGSITDNQAVNGINFRLHGLREYRPTFPGQEAEVVLTYNLNPDEQLYVASPGSPNHISRRYTMEAAAVVGAYSPRLFTYPQWDDSGYGYRLQHFLYDLNRDSVIDVTEHVTLNDKSPIYKPRLFGTAQNLIFNINLRDVNPSNESVIFIQHTEITLLKDKVTSGDRWQVAFEPSKPAYKAFNAIFKVIGGNPTFNVKFGAKNLNEWLDLLYYSVHPSYDSWNEGNPPKPTHFDFMHEDGRRWRFPVTAWDEDNIIDIHLEVGKTYYLNWIRRLSNGEELQLANTGVVVESA